MGRLYIGSKIHTPVIAIPGPDIKNQDKTFTSNGTYTCDEGYTGLGTVTVNVEGTSTRYDTSIDNFLPASTGVGVIKLPRSTAAFNVDFTGINEVNSYALSYKFANNLGLRTVTLPNVEYINTYSFDHAFMGCTNLTSFSIGSNLIGGHEVWSAENGYQYAFSGCTRLTNVDLNIGLLGMDNQWLYAFQGCTSLTDVPFTKVRTASYNVNMPCQFAFKNCTGLVNVTFPALSHAYGAQLFYKAFDGCTNLRSISFPALKQVQSSQYGYYRVNQFRNMLFGCNNVTVHFPSNMQTAIGGWDDVVNGFGGSNTTVLFDLEATE